MAIEFLERPVREWNWDGAMDERWSRLRRLIAVAGERASPPAGRVGTGMIPTPGSATPMLIMRA